MTAKCYLELHIDEDRYAVESGQAFAQAEANATAYPVAYPEPYSTIGCGWGTLGRHVESLAQNLANDMGLDWDCCHQTILQLTLYCGTPLQYSLFCHRLHEATNPVRAWVTIRSDSPPINVNDDGANGPLKTLSDA